MTLLEVMVAGLVMSLSLMALAMTMVQGLAAMVIVEEQLIAKQKAREVLESVFTARSTQNLAFTDIESLSGGGIFLEGWQPIRGMGVDGIANTADDSATPIESIPLPGADGVWLTADDEMRVLDTFERRIVFSPVLMPSSTVDQEIRNVTVDVRFLSHGSWWTVSVSSYISRFA
jgi:hypothetical protein